MANVLKWNYGSLSIKFKKDGYYFNNTISVDGAILDGEVPCFHCGKEIKKGKVAWLASNGISNPFERGDSSWGSSKESFCSSNHAKLFAKNNDGL